MPWLTVEENVGFGLDIKGVKSVSVRSLLGKVGGEL